MRIKKTIIIILLLIILTGCKEKVYTITFDTDGGSTMSSIMIKEGEKLKNIKPPEKDGYLFVDWLKNGVEYNLNLPVKENITLKANWIKTPEIDTFNVTYVNDTDITKEVVKANTILKEPKQPKKENHTFLGWFIGDTPYNFNDKVNKDIILVAKYQIETVTIRYELDGGIGIETEIIEKGSYLKIPNQPTKEGYKFLKWTTNGKEFSFTNTIEEDITLTAIWEPIEYIKITFDTDGGDHIEELTIEKYSQIASLPIPEKEGYIFQKWQLEGQKFNIDNKIETDITLKAIYKKIGE